MWTSLSDAHAESTPSKKSKSKKGQKQSKQKQNKQTLPENIQQEEKTEKPGKLQRDFSFNVLSLTLSARARLY